MKKILVFLMASFMLIGFASAIYMPNDTGKNADGQMQSEDGEPVYRIMAAGENGAGAQNGQAARRIQSGERIQLQSGETLRIGGNQNRMMLQVNNRSAECYEGCNLTQEEDGIHATMSNGRDAEIKVMPNVASEVALERLRLNMCDNCTLQLKEVGEGNQTRMTYEMKAQKRARVLGIFGSNMKVEASVDAETGEVVRSRKPWWAFLASESDEAEPLEE